jgi:hypothetical protein
MPSELIHDPGAEAWRSREPSSDHLAEALAALIRAKEDKLPLPGSGKTLERWRALARLGSGNLSVAKVFESHVDAIAILTELHVPHEDGELLAIWAAENPGKTVSVTSGSRLVGAKPWCSAAHIVNKALITAARGHERLLVLVPMNQPGVHVDASSWQAIGMRETASAIVEFDGAVGEIIGRHDDYLVRPGFWQGGAGIAAIWFGAACSVASQLSKKSNGSMEAHAAAHYGAVDIALNSAKAALIEAAGWIDKHPAENAQLASLRVRLAVEKAVEKVLRRTARALGPGPLCLDADHAQRCADLEVFIRQSHAERDLAVLGRMLGQSPKWQL